MAEEIRSGWVKSPDGVKFAPKTFAKQVIVGDTTLDNVIDKLPVMDTEDTEGTVVVPDYAARIEELETENAELKNQITELNSNMQWKTWKMVTGTNTIEFPEEFSELYICVYCVSGTKLYNSFGIIPKTSFYLGGNPGLADAEYYYLSGGYDGADQRYVRIETNKVSNFIRINRVMVDSVDYTNNSSITVYYR